jgi:Fic family protein
MVLNNHRTMTWMLEQRDTPLTPQLVLEAHRRMTEGTLEEADGAGRLRREDENIVLVDIGSDDVVHRPPAARELVQRMEAMCAFANDSTNEPFLHPVVRSIVLHFWLAYDHPFVDGNGRTARALFYWSMLRRGYWLAEFLPVSRIFHAAPAKYARAFQYVETDDNDFTYFALYHADVLMRAIADLHVYLARKAEEQQSLSRLLRRSVDLNHRQIGLLTSALRDLDAEFTIESHRATQGVVYQTARADLLDLVSRGLLEQRRVGRTLVFTPQPDLEQRLRRLK